VRDTFLLSILLASSLGFSQAPTSAPKALTREQLTRLVAAGMDNEQLTKTLAERGIGFELTGTDLQDLRKAGAQPALLQAVAEAALAQSREPLKKDMLPHLVGAGVESDKLAHAVQVRGMDLPLAAEEFDNLKRLGADESLLKALREANPKPLNSDQVLNLVTGGIPAARAELLIRRRGIDFNPSDDYLETLRIAGAEEPLLNALQEAILVGDILVETVPGALVRLDGQSRGRADAQGHLTIRDILRGEHKIRLALAGYVGQSQSITVAAKQTTKLSAPLPKPTPGVTIVDVETGEKYVWVPPGTFTMGCSAGEDKYYCEDYPPHKVMITKGFWMGQTEVTVGAYRRFSTSAKRPMPDAPIDNPGWANDQMPMVNVRWDEASAYCEWAGGRLPTEAEWEYAARDGSTEARYGPPDEIAWYEDNSGGKPHEVAQKRPNAWGLFDTLGNVMEWVSDWYDRDYYKGSPERDPQGPSYSQFHVTRGNYFGTPDDSLRVSDRNYHNSASRIHGFRCVAEVK